MEIAIWEILAQGGPTLAVFAAAGIVIAIVVKTKTKIEERMDRGEASFQRGDEQHKEIRQDIRGLQQGQSDILQRIVRLETKIDKRNGD